MHKGFLHEGEEAHVQIREYDPSTPPKLASNLKPGDVVYIDEFQVLFCIPKDSVPEQPNILPTLGEVCRTVTLGVTVIPTLVGKKVG